jgi:hypothetical protein
LDHATCITDQFRRPATGSDPTDRIRAPSTGRRQHETSRLPSARNQVNLSAPDVCPDDRQARPRQAARVETDDLALWTGRIPEDREAHRTCRGPGAPISATTTCSGPDLLLAPCELAHGRRPARYDDVHACARRPGTVSYPESDDRPRSPLTAIDSRFVTAPNRPRPADRCENFGPAAQ